MLSPDDSIRALEASVRQYFGVRHVFLVSSGKAALTMTLMGLKAASPDEFRELDRLAASARLAAVRAIVKICG